MKAKSEFVWIDRYFKQPFASAPSADAAISSVYGIGDDCALIPQHNGDALAISTDSLNEGVHFLPDTAPEDLAYKALAVNLSDLAAMGATPQYFFLALNLPDWPCARYEAWLQRFSHALQAASRHYAVVLLGGDTCKSAHLSMTLTVVGVVPLNLALKRSGAKLGDGVYVSGRLGLADLGLQVQQGRLTLSQADEQRVMQALLRPQPQIRLGQALRGVASAAIDLSDGLYADLQHVCQASGLGAQLDVNALPLANLELGLVKPTVPRSTLLHSGLSGGEDYQLCFTIPSAHEKSLDSVLAGHHIQRIGQMQRTPGIQLLGAEVDAQSVLQGFEHFSMGCTL